MLPAWVGFRLLRRAGRVGEKPTVMTQSALKRVQIRQRASARFGCSDAEFIRWQCRNTLNPTLLTFVLSDTISYLPYLIHFCFAAIALQVDFFNNSSTSEHMITSANTFFETQVHKQLTQILERDIRIGCAAQDAFKQLVVFSHTFRA